MEYSLGDVSFVFEKKNKGLQEMVVDENLPNYLLIIHSTRRRVEGPFKIRHESNPICIILFRATLLGQTFG